MTIVDRLIAADHKSPKRIAFLGDALIDSWVTGQVSSCQDACLRFDEAGPTVQVPGGAANAARQLARWKSQAWLISPMRIWQLSSAWNDLNTDLVFKAPNMPEKRRFLAGDKIVFRHDYDPECYVLNEQEIAECQQLALKALKTMNFDAVLISDYMKGWLSPAFIRQVIDLCDDLAIPVVADGKRPPEVYRGAILKVNSDYALAHYADTAAHTPCAVITFGADPPSIMGEHGLAEIIGSPPVVCKNHVGAGDCFAAVLTLGLAHEMKLGAAVQVAHHAGRCYVQKRFNEPVWPHEIRRDHDPVGGKVFHGEAQVRCLRDWTSGRIVFTNGVFRVPGANHAEMLAWAKAQGDILVVGVNDDESVARIRPGEFCLPLAERAYLLASFSTVDWVIPFPEDDPCGIIRELRPEVLVKGEEYLGTKVPGDDLVADVRFAPEAACGRHASDLVGAIKNGGHLC